MQVFPFHDFIFRLNSASVLESLISLGFRGDFVVFVLGGRDFVVRLQHKSQEVFQHFWQALY